METNSTCVDSRRATDAADVDGDSPRGSAVASHRYPGSETQLDVSIGEKNACCDRKKGRSRLLERERRRKKRGGGGSDCGDTGRGCCCHRDGSTAGEAAAAVAGSGLRWPTEGHREYGAMAFLRGPWATVCW